MKIQILAVGKIGKNYLKEGIADYSKRISKHCTFSICEIPEQSSGNTQQIRDKEGQALLEQLKKWQKNPANFSIALSPAQTIKTIKIFEGTGEAPPKSKPKQGQPKKLLSSEQFAELLADKQNRGFSSFCFIIGGSEGLSASVLAEADFLLAFSALTFPHQLFRLMLCEQIYRCLKISSGQSYHK